MKKLAALVLSTAIALPSLGAAQNMPYSQAQPLCDSIASLSANLQMMRNNGEPEAAINAMISGSNMTLEVEALLLGIVMAIYDRPPGDPSATKAAARTTCFRQLAGI